MAITLEVADGQYGIVLRPDGSVAQAAVPDGEDRAASPADLLVAALMSCAPPNGRPNLACLAARDALIAAFDREDA